MESEFIDGASRALVLLSGGLDSAVALYWAISRAWEVATIEFEYYLRPKRERYSCRSLRVFYPDSFSAPIAR